MPFCMKFQRVLAIKFLVVDGITQTAARIASGQTSDYSNISLRDLRDCGYSIGDKDSATLKEFIDHLKIRKIIIFLPEDFSDLNVDPLSFYLNKGHLTVNISQQEIAMAYDFLVKGISMKKIEEIHQIQRRQRNASRLAVYKLGGFHGHTDRKSLTEKDFQKRLADLGLKWD